MSASVTSIEKAIERKDAGISSSASRANESSPGWADRAYSYMVKFASLTESPWTVEQFRHWAMSNGLDKPVEERAYGAVTMRALRHGVMVRIGFAPAASSNCGAKPLYARPALKVAA